MGLPPDWSAISLSSSPECSGAPPSTMSTLSGPRTARTFAPAPVISRNLSVSFVTPSGVAAVSAEAVLTRAFRTTVMPVAALPKMRRKLRRFDGEITGKYFTIAGLTGVRHSATGARACYAVRMRLFLPFLMVVLVGCSSSSSTGGGAGDPKAYLDKAAAQPGAVRTASGLVYRELRTGLGRSPNASDTVIVNYRGTLVDGTEFDSSYKR